MDAMSIFISFLPPLTLCALCALRVLCVTFSFSCFSLRTQRLRVKVSSVSSRLPRASFARGRRGVRP